MDINKAIEKVRKCLALAKSSNAHEAAAAMRQAQALMREHGIDQVDIELAAVSESATDARMQTLTQWETMLVQRVADAFCCTVYTSKRWLPKSGSGLLWPGPRTFVFVGVGHQADIASYAYDVLSRQCAKARLAHIAAQPKACKPITKTARGDEFARAWVMAATLGLWQFAGAEQQAQLVHDYMQARHPSMTDAKPVNRAVGRNVRSESHFAGYEAGAGAQLNHGVGKGADAPRLQG